MRMLREDGVLKAPPPPKEAERLLKSVVGQGSFRPEPPKGWIDDDEAIKLLQVSRETITRLVSEGFLRASGYGTGNNNRRCIGREEAVLFAKLFPEGAIPTGDNAKMLTWAAISYAKEAVGREAEWTPKGALDYANETLAIVQWVYTRGENRRPRNKSDAMFGLFRWLSQAQREAYHKEMAEKNGVREAAIQSEVAGVLAVIESNPGMEQDAIDGMINAGQPEIRDEVLRRVKHAMGENRRDRTEAELDAMLFTTVDTKGNRTAFVMKAIYARAQQMWRSGQKPNLTACEAYASSRLMCSNWMAKLHPRAVTEEDIFLSGMLYPTDKDYRAYIAWKHVKLAFQNGEPQTRKVINRVIEELNLKRIDDELELIEEPEVHMAVWALGNEGWKDVGEVTEPVIDELPIAEDKIVPICYLARDIAMDRFGIDGDLLTMLDVTEGVRTTLVDLVGDGRMRGYNELDLMIFRHIQPSIAADDTVNEISEYIRNLRDVASYEDGKFLINGRVPEKISPVVHGETDVYLSLAEISVLLKMHVSTVGALSNLGIARVKDGLISLLDVTIFNITYDPKQHDGTPYTFLKENAEHVKEVIEGNRDLFTYSHTRHRYERTTKMTTKKTEKTPKKATKATTPAKSDKKVTATKTEERKLLKPAVKVSKEKKKAIEAAVKAVKAKKETPREEAQEASAAAESVSKLGPVMMAHKEAYKAFGVAVARIRVLIKQGILRGDALVVSHEDMKHLHDLYPDGVLTDKPQYVAIVAKQIKDLRKEGISKNVEKAVESMKNTAAAVLGRKDDNDAELVVVARPLETLDDVRHFFSGAVAERYGTDPANWPDVMRSLGLSLGVIKKNG